jgi:hypothetical protein
MDEIFGLNEDFINTTINTSLEKIPHEYTAEEIALMLGALGAMVASIIYSIKNVKHSSCCFGVFNCDQRTEIPPREGSINPPVYLTRNESNV